MARICSMSSEFLTVSSDLRMLCAILPRTVKFGAAFFDAELSEILPIQDVGNPVAAVTDAPVLPDRIPEGLRVGIEAADLKPFLFSAPPVKTPGFAFLAGDPSEGEMEPVDGLVVDLSPFFRSVF